MKLHRGDRVKLTEQGARVQTKTYFRRAKRVDWFARRGTVHRVGKLHAYIMWDGRKSIDYQPLALVERERD